MSDGLYTDIYDSPVGEITVTADGHAVVWLSIAGQRTCPDTAGGARRADLRIFRQVRDWLDVYFSGRDPGPVPPLAPRGSAFRTRVWEILLEIPYGKVRTYGEIAAQIAAERGKARMSAQAVGGAVGHNPISILIPCHRVIGSDGSLVGYGGGLGKKIALLRLEGLGEFGPNGRFGS